LPFSAAEWLGLFTHFASLSLLAVGGAITTVPDMHRFLVDERQWLSDAQFSSSIAMAQAAPGPNVLFVALMGFNVGMNVGGPGTIGYAWALLGVTVSMIGTLLPSTTLTFLAARWGHQNRERRSVRAFKTGMAPIVVALLVATGWILSTSLAKTADHWPVWAVSVVAAVVVWRTKIHLLWLLGAGGLMGWMGWL
jgi:chromate transporter